MNLTIEKGAITFAPFKKLQYSTTAALFLSVYIHAQNHPSDSVHTQIQTIELVGRKSKGYISDYSFAATKIAMKNIDIPVTLNTITKELITDRQAFLLGDVMKNMTGVSPSSYYNQYNIRGISQNEEGQIINGMRTRQYYFLQPVPAGKHR